MSLFHSASQLLNQLAVVLHEMEEVNYSQPVPTLSQATVGQHVRHTLEFFLCLFDARNVGEINYDGRARDPFLETDIKLAISIIHDIIAFLDKNPEDLPIALLASYDINDDEPTAIQTTLYREVAYNIEHTIHHMALIKIGILSLQPNFEFPAHFGVASSTVRYRQSKK